MLVRPDSILVLSLACAAGSAVAAFLAVGPEPQDGLIADHDTHHFGRVNRGMALNATFRLINRGDQPVEVLEIVTSCGCAVLDVSGKRVGPGDSITAHAKLDTAGSLGLIERQIDIRHQKNPIGEVRGLRIKLQAEVDGASGR